MFGRFRAFHSLPDLVTFFLVYILFKDYLAIFWCFATSLLGFVVHMLSSSILVSLTNYHAVLVVWYLSSPPTHLCIISTPASHLSPSVLFSFTIPLPLTPLMQTTFLSIYCTIVVITSIVCPNGMVVVPLDNLVFFVSSSTISFS